MLFLNKMYQRELLFFFVSFFCLVRGGTPIVLVFMFNVRTRVFARHQQQLCVCPAPVDHHRHATITPLYPKLVLGLLPPPACGALASAGLVEVDYGRLGVLSSTAAYTFHFQIKPRRHSAQLASVLETGVADEEAEKEFRLVYVWLGREAEDGAHAAARAQVGRALQTHGEAKVMSIFVVVGRTRGCRRAPLSYDMYLVHQAVGTREFLVRVPASLRLDSIIPCLQRTAAPCVLPLCEYVFRILTVVTRLQSLELIQGESLLGQRSCAMLPSSLLEVEQGCEPALFLALFSYMLPPLAAVVLQGRDEGPGPDLR